MSITPPRSETNHRNYRNALHFLRRHVLQTFVPFRQMKKIQLRRFHGLYHVHRGRRGWKGYPNFKQFNRPRVTLANTEAI
jgi:hypothetical protein